MNTRQDEMTCGTAGRISRRGLLRGALGVAAAAMGVAGLPERRLTMARADGADALPTVVVQWNKAALQSIRDAKPGPPMCARALAIVHTCMYDAWTAYDPVARPTRPNGIAKVASHRSHANKTKAISYAAYRALLDLFPAEASLFTGQLAGLGYDPGDTSTDTTTPSGIGNV